MNEGNGAGKGSQPEVVEGLLQWLTILIWEYGIESINDAGCGQKLWIPDDHFGVDYQAYDGIDFGHNIVLDISKEPMRRADLIICKDVFRHMPPNDIETAIQLFDAHLLLADSDHGAKDHIKANTPLDLRQFMGQPLGFIESKEHPDKRFCLWGLPCDRI